MSLSAVPYGNPHHWGLPVKRRAKGGAIRILKDLGKLTCKKQCAPAFRDVMSVAHCGSCSSEGDT